MVDYEIIVQQIESSLKGREALKRNIAKQLPGKSNKVDDGGIIGKYRNEKEERGACQASKRGKKMRQKELWVAMGGLILVASLCVSQVVFAGKPISGEVVVLSLGEGIFGEPFVKLSPEFEKEYPGVKVTNLTFGYNEAVKKYFAAFAAKNPAYDVLQIDYIHSKGFSAAGHLEPLDEYLGKEWIDDFVKDCPENVYGMYTYEEKFYGLPTIGNSQKFIYNMKMLAGVGYARPDTWDEVLEASKRITKAGKDQYGFVAGFERLVKVAALWFQLFWADGGEVFDENLTPQLNTKPGVDALKTLLELIKYGPPGVGAYAETDETKAIGTGLAAMDPFVWIPAAITRPMDPEMAKYLWMDVVPKGKVRRGPVMGGLGLVVSTYSGNKDAAAEYVKWFNTKKVQMIVIQNGGQPARTSGWIENLHLDKQGYLKAAMDNMRVAVVRPQIPEYAQLDSILGLHGSRAFTGELTPKEAMDGAQKDTLKMMKEAGYYK